MHCLSNIGIFKCQDARTVGIISKFTEIRKTELEDFYFINATGRNKKMLACNGVDTLVVINTDYFGGVGEQSATIINLTTDYRNRLKPLHFNSINKAFSKIGVNDLIYEDKDKIERTKDQFEVIGIHKYRTNQDIFYKKGNNV